MAGDRYQVVLAGVGGAGCNTLAGLRASWPDSPDMLAIHTSTVVLGGCPVARQMAIGGAVTQGLGTGGDPEIGLRAAEASHEEIRAAFGGVDLAFVVAGMGGGTGSGAAPRVCAAAREAGAVVLAVATLPFFFEGSKRRMRAEEGLKHLRQSADAVVVFPNQRVIEWVDEGAQVETAFRMIDHMVGGALRTLWKLVTEPGLLKLDFADLRQLVQQTGGTLAMASAEASGPDRVVTVLDELRNSPLLDHGALLPAARGLLIGISGGSDLTLTELQKVMAELTGQARPDVHLHVGTAVDGAIEGRLCVSVVLTEGEDRAPESAPPEPAPPAVEGTPAPGGDDLPPKGVRRGRSGKAVQSELTLDSISKGRFRDVQPTVHDGVDLDVPTFVRRGVRLSRVGAGA
jgi:cell division protein FtsZ